MFGEVGKSSAHLENLDEKLRLEMDQILLEEEGFLEIEVLDTMVKGRGTQHEVFPTSTITQRQRNQIPWLKLANGT